MLEEREALNSIEIDTEFIRNYDDRIESLLISLAQEFEIKLAKLTLNSHKKIGEIIFRSYIADISAEDGLNYMGYEFFGEFEARQFEKEIGDRKKMVTAILEGKALVGYSSDFSKILIACQGSDYTNRITTYVN